MKARDIWAKSVGYNENCNTRNLVSVKADHKMLLSRAISTFKSTLSDGARTANQMAVLLRAVDAEQAQLVEDDQDSCVPRKRRLEDALGETHDEFKVKLRKADGEPEATLDAEAA